MIVPVSDLSRREISFDKVDLPQPTNYPNFLPHKHQLKSLLLLLPHKMTKFVVPNFVRLTKVFDAKNRLVSIF